MACTHCCDTQLLDEGSKRFERLNAWKHVCRQLNEAARIPEQLSWAKCLFLHAFREIGQVHKQAIVDKLFGNHLAACGDHLLHLCQIVPLGAFERLEAGRDQKAVMSRNQLTMILGKFVLVLQEVNFMIA